MHNQPTNGRNNHISRNFNIKCSYNVHCGLFGRRIVHLIKTQKLYSAGIMLNAFANQIMSGSHIGCTFWARCKDLEQMSCNLGHVTLQNHIKLLMQTSLLSSLVCSNITVTLIEKSHTYSTAVY